MSDRHIPSKGLRLTQIGKQGFEARTGTTQSRLGITSVEKVEAPPPGRVHAKQGVGAAYRIRTYDPIITNDVLYQLS